VIGGSWWAPLRGTRDDQGVEAAAPGSHGIGGIRIGSLGVDLNYVQDGVAVARIKGDAGDFKKTGGRGGAITAALCLARFREGLPWACLDIAGSARGGLGARTLLTYLDQEERCSANIKGRRGAVVAPARRRPVVSVRFGGGRPGGLRLRRAARH
jgi:hypothetical protein